MGSYLLFLQSRLPPSATRTQKIISTSTCTAVPGLSIDYYYTSLGVFNPFLAIGMGPTMKGYIDTSDINVAEIREYWQDLVVRSSAGRCSSDSQNNSNASSVNSTRSTMLVAPTTCAGPSTSTASSSSLVNTSLFDGFNSDEPMLLMAVSADSAACMHSTPPSAPPPFQVDLSPIGCGSNKKSIGISKSKHNTVVQEWPDLATANNMDEIPTRLAAPAATRYSRVHVSNIRKKYKEKRSTRSAKTKHIADNTPLIATNDRSDITRNATTSGAPDLEEEEVENRTRWNTAVQQRTNRGRVAFVEWSSAENGATSTFSYPRLYQRLESRIGKAKGNQ